MITELFATGYKGLTGRTFGFRPLTVLTGTNCAGKSSLIQTLLLARQASLAEHAGPVTVPLNGAHDLRLGTAFDVMAFNANDDRTIRIAMTTDGAIRHEWIFAVDKDQDRFLTCTQAPGQVDSGLTATGPGDFAYLSALREGQPDLVAVQSLPHAELTLGCRGEYAADLLRAFAQHPVEAGLQHPRAGRLPLLKQVEHWLSELVTPVEVRVEASQTLDAVGLRYLQGDKLGEWVRPSNTGYGLSYCLPIKDGYRRLTFMMLDCDIAAVSPASTYRVLKEAGLMRKWDEKESKKLTVFIHLTISNEYWRVNISYLNISGILYYFCGLLDGCSRYIVHWEIREAMTEKDVEIVIQRAREKYPEAGPRITLTMVRNLLPMNSRSLSNCAG
ncbi:MAG: hypothetical protein HQL95_10845 [Magnetococcales bacterium]|nr:hypothetical protein [Magnetococcales bacterium]